MLAGAPFADTVPVAEVVAESLRAVVELALVVVLLAASPPQSAGWPATVPQTISFLSSKVRDSGATPNLTYP